MINGRRWIVLHTYIALQSGEPLLQLVANDETAISIHSAYTSLLPYHLKPPPALLDTGLVFRGSLIRPVNKAAGSSSARNAVSIFSLCTKQKEERQCSLYVSILDFPIVWLPFPSTPARHCGCQVAAATAAAGVKAADRPKERSFRKGRRGKKTECHCPCSPSLLEQPAAQINFPFYRARPLKRRYV